MHQAEFAAFQRKIKLRADDLASELVNEFLIKERTKEEWKGISSISVPHEDPHDPAKVLLSPLADFFDQVKFFSSYRFC